MSEQWTEEMQARLERVAQNGNERSIGAFFRAALAELTRLREENERLERKVKESEDRLIFREEETDQLIKAAEAREGEAVRFSALAIAEAQDELTAAREELQRWKACNLYPQSYREAVEALDAAREAHRLLINTNAEHVEQFRAACEQVRVLREALHNVAVIQGDTVTGDLARAALRSSEEPKLNKVDEDPDGRC